MDFKKYFSNIKCDQTKKAIHLNIRQIRLYYDKEKIPVEEPDFFYYFKIEDIQAK